MLTGLPTKKNELWKYTSLKPIQETDWVVSTDSSDTNLSHDQLALLSKSLRSDMTNFVFVDGQLNKTLSDLNSMVTVTVAPAGAPTTRQRKSAPGGKAFLIAAAQGGAENLTCTDSNEKRLPRLRENLERLHAAAATIAIHDWTQPAPAHWHGAFDGILLDVPCSNTGVIRRRVDVRWRLQAPDLEKLATTQRLMLEQALPCLKPGGRLVYSTCSIEPAENLGQVEAFLADHPELTLVATREALPFRDATDGAFAACLQRHQ